MPQKKSKENGRRVTSPGIVMPTHPRKNYHLRTYSGANLAKSTKLDGVEKNVMLASQTLMWDNLRQVLAFPQLSRLDYLLEKKVLDLISVKLAESAYTDRFQSEVVLAKKDLEKATLSFVERKKLAMQEKYNQILINFKESVKSIADRSDKTLRLKQNKFATEWASSIDLFNCKIKKFEKLSSLDLASFTKLKDEVKLNFDDFYKRALHFKQDIQAFDAEVSEDFKRAITSAALKMKRLSLSFRNVDDLLKNECLQFHEKITNDQSDISQYIESLEYDIAGLELNVNEELLDAENNWREERFNFVYAQFQEAAHKCASVDTASLYEQYQKKFDNFTSIMTENILQVLRWDPKTGLQKNLKVWTEKHDTNAALQYLEIEKFSNDCEELKRKICQELDRVARDWLPFIKECTPNAEDAIYGFLNSVRKTINYDSARRAYLQLQANFKLNNFIWKTVIQYVKCISFTNSIFHQIQVLDVEVDVSREQFLLYEEYSKSVKLLERELDSEFTAIRVATKKSTIEKRMDKAKEIIEKMKFCYIERHQKCVEHLQSFRAKAKSEFQLYQRRLRKLFQDYRFKSSGNSKEQFYNLRLFPMRVHEWLEDHAILIEEAKVKRAPPTPLHTEASTDGDIDLHAEQSVLDPNTTANLLLDGTNVMEIRDVVAKMEGLIFAIEPFEKYFLDINSDGPQVVKMALLDSYQLNLERINLFEAVTADSLVIWEECEKDINQKIKSKTISLDNEKIIKIAKCDSILIELNELVEFRTTQLLQLQSTHENEARFLLDAMNLMQSNFTKRLNPIIDEIHDFIEFTIPDTNRRVSNCKTLHQIQSLKKQFENLIERFNCDVNEALKQATEDFDKAKKNIELSKQKGHHSSAWQIIKESGAYHPGTVDSVLEFWKIGITENIAKEMKDALNQISVTRKGFDYTEKDLELDHQLTSKVKSLKTKLRSESTWCKKQMDSLANAVQNFKSDSTAPDSWSKALSLLASAIEIDVVILKLTEYLSLEQHPQKFIFSSSARPHRESWKEWRTDQQSSNDNGKLELETRDKPSATSRFPPINQLKEDVCKSSASLLNKQSISTKSIASLPTSSTSSKDLLLLPTLPTKLIQAPSLLNMDGIKSERIHNLNELFRNWCLNAHDALIRAYERAAPSLHRESSLTSVVIKKGEILPPPPPPFVIKIKKELDVFMSFAQRFQDDQVKCLSQIVDEFQTAVQTANAAIFKYLYEHALERLNDNWNLVVDKFMRERNDIDEVRTLTHKVLEGIMAESNPINKLEDLDNTVKQSCKQFQELVAKSKSDCDNNFQTFLKDISSRIQFLSIIAADIEYNMYRPGERKVIPTSTVLFTLPKFKGFEISGEGIYRHNSDLQHSSIDDTQSVGYKTIITARNTAINQIQDKVDSLKQCLNAQTKSDLLNQDYWLRRWNTQLSMIKESLVTLNKPRN